MTPKITAFPVRRLRSGDHSQFHQMLDLFAEAFEDPQRYRSAQPGPDYRDALLARDDVVMLVALDDHTVVGALVAYELRKFEQECSEFYIYDLAVAEAFRRRGIATALIDALKAVVKTSGGGVVFVQADYGDDPAIALYTKLGTREDVMHFDLARTEKLRLGQVSAPGFSGALSFIHGDCRVLSLRHA